MILKIISKNDKGTKGLRAMMKESQSRKARMFYKIIIIDESPLTINFKFTRLASQLGNSQVIRNTVINGLKEQLNQEYNLTENEIEVLL